MGCLAVVDALVRSIVFSSEESRPYQIRCRGHRKPTRSIDIAASQIQSITIHGRWTGFKKSQADRIDGQQYPAGRSKETYTATRYIDDVDDDHAVVVVVVWHQKVPV